MIKVLVFGTFDPLHEGHSHFFRQAKALGGHLTVVTALDSTIKQFKQRPPHQSQDERLAEVQADPSVNQAILGDQQPDQYRLLEKLDFDILALGYDQTPSDDEVRDKLKQAGKKHVQVVRLKSHQPHRFKSGKMRRQTNNQTLYDCHLHSHYSDGILTPSALISAAHQHRLKGISLTDHNGTWGIKEAAAAAAKYNLDFIAGIEVSGVWQGEHVHLLAYSRHFDFSLLEQGLAGNRQAYLEKIKGMIKKCPAQGFGDITFSAAAARRHGQKNPVYLFSDLAQLLAQHYALPLSEAWAMTVEGGALYQPLNTNKLLSVSAVLDLVHQANGIVSLAHPGLIEKTVSAEYLARLLNTLIPAGLDAIEDYHHTNDAQLTERLTRQVTDNNLLATGGSDWHGPNIHARRSFGKIGLDETHWQKLLSTVDQ